MLEIIKIPAKESVRSVILWLHGLGADADDFISLSDAWHFPHTQFVFPRAPVRPVTANGGFPMRAWYDILGFAENTPQDRSGIRAARDMIEELITKEEAAGVDSRKMILGGFSQGGAMALYIGMRRKKPLGGVIDLSGYLPLADDSAKEVEVTAKKTPIWIGHGHFDPLVPFSWSKRARDDLEKLGFSVEWHAYPIAHSVCDDEVRDMGAFIAGLLRRSTGSSQ